MQEINEQLSRHLDAKATVTADFAENIYKALDRAYDAWRALSDLKGALKTGNIKQAVEILNAINDGEYQLDSLLNMVGVGSVEVEGEKGVYEVQPLLEEIATISATAKTA